MNRLMRHQLAVTSRRNPQFHNVDCRVDLQENLRKTWQINIVIYKVLL